jgi:hypothetical protein
MRFVVSVDDGRFGFGFALHQRISGFPGDGGSGPQEMDETSVGEHGGSRDDVAHTGIECGNRLDVYGTDFWVPWRVVFRQSHSSWQ